MMNNIAFFNAAKKKEYNVVHPTYYDTSFLKHIGNTPFVLTVHDMIHEKYAHTDLFKNDSTTSKNKRFLCEKASKIIAVSQNTKKDLIDIFQVDPCKIEVTHLGQSFENRNNKIMHELHLPDRYILFTGQRDGYKNFSRFAEAFAVLHARDKDLHLICTGPLLSETETVLLRKLHVLDSVQHLFVNDQQMKELYSKAALFVFPSEYEGFGIPVLESFACGCPIALSDASSFPEVAGSAGVFFDPKNVDSMVDAVSRILNSEKYRTEKIEEGYLQMQKFSWKKMAEETCAIYRGLCYKSLYE